MNENEKKEEIYANLRQFVADVIGEDVVDELDVNSQSVL